MWKEATLLSLHLVNNGDMKNSKLLICLFVGTLFSCNKNQSKQTIEDKQSQSKIENVYVSKDSIEQNSEKHQENTKYLIEKKVEPDKNIDNILINDLESKDYLQIAKKWSKLYDKLPQKFKNTVYSNNSETKMEYGDLYGLNKGFYWGLCDKFSDNLLGETIINDFGATGGKSRNEEIIGYRSGMVYFYVKYKLLKCED